jgi:DNA-binding transcriptional ArsR family regulator
MGQSRISTQLSQLKGGGLVRDERSGKHNFYRSEMAPALTSLAKEAAKELPEVAKDASALRHLQRKRRDKTRAYFDELAGRFGKDYVPAVHGKVWPRHCSKSPTTASSPTSGG